MTPISVLTLVKNREAHLHNVAEGLQRSAVPPAELIVVDMSDVPVAPLRAPFPIHCHRLESDGLPLAAARNLAASKATSPCLLFLDVDCIPMRDCLGTMAATLDREDALLCADIRYLAAGDVTPSWTEPALLKAGRRHPLRVFPAHGVRREANAGLFWSLAFAIRRGRFRDLGGFDEAFCGYGAEDTDFGFRAEQAGLPLLFVGGAVACHQHHANYDPPVQHFHDILRNAAVFRARWGWWPMRGWLDAYRAMGLIHIAADQLTVVREPDAGDLTACEVH